MTATRKWRHTRIGNERTYLNGVALRVAANWKRKHQRRADRTVCLDFAPLADAATTTPEDAIALKDSLGKLLGMLPGELQRVLVLAEMCDFNVVQIAETERIPAGTVASRLRRARQLISKRLLA